MKKRLTEQQLTNMVKNAVKRIVNEATDYGWEVPDSRAREAYDFACERMGKEYVDESIIDCLSHEQLASCLAFIFRMNDFQEWDEFLNGNENEDEE